jgi:hypothetical protein
MTAQTMAMMAAREGWLVLLPPTLLLAGELPLPEDVAVAEESALR